MLDAKAGGWVELFRSVGGRDAADAAYRDVLAAVLKSSTQCPAATEALQSPSFEPGAPLPKALSCQSAKLPQTNE